MAFAILFSAFLILAVWLIERRKAWKVVGKWSLYSVAAVLAVGMLSWGGVLVYEKTEQSWRAQRQAAELANFREKGLDTYLGVRLGMKEEEAVFVLGSPKTRTVAPTDPSRVFLLWSKYPPKFTQVGIASGAVHAVGCGGELSYECPSLMTVEIGDSEGTVLDKLGHADSEELVRNGESKELIYGPSTGYVRILIEAGGSGVRYVELRKEIKLLEGAPLNGSEQQGESEGPWKKYRWVPYR